MPEARAETVTTSSRLIRPLSRASIISSRVITLVTLAGSICRLASFSYKIVPVSFSISTADGALSSSGDGAAASWADAVPVSSSTASTRDPIRFISLCLPIGISSGMR